MKAMQDRKKTKWRIVYDATFGSDFPYRVEYQRDRGGWAMWQHCMTLFGAKYALRRAKRISTPVGGVMLIHEE